MAGRQEEKDAGSAAATRDSATKRQIPKLQEYRRGGGRPPASLESEILNAGKELGVSIREMEENALTRRW